MKRCFPLALLALSCFFTQHLHAQTKPFPNELKGFELYGRGKTAGLHLGVSSKEDVARVFGGDCAQKCDFDEKWHVEFSYFGDFRSWWGEKEMTPKPQYVDKIHSIRFTPKSRIKLAKNKFSRKFAQGNAGGSGSHSNRTTFYDVYYDESGLSYTVFEKIVIEDDSGKPTVTDSSKKGDLAVITYRITDKQEEQMWIEK
jgi:hypothetical protein